MAPTVATATSSDPRVTEETTVPDIAPRELAARLASAICLTSAAVHAALVPQHLSGSAILGAGFVLAATALAGAGLSLGPRATPGRWRFAGGTCLVVATGYVVSRTTGLFGHTHGDDVLGVVTTLAELAVVAMAAIRATGFARVGRVLRTRAVRAATALTLGVALFVPVAIPDATAAGETPDGCQEPSRHISLYAVELPRSADGDIRLAWSTDPEPAAASIPGPLIEMIEGECLAVHVTNLVSATTLTDLRSRYPDQQELPLGVSLHVHGVRYTSASDGTLHTGSWVPPGATRTYVWYAAPRVVTAGRVTSMGTAGYWWYHDHAAGTAHGTGGLDAGLFGGLVVRRPGDLALPADRRFTTVFGPTATIHCTSRVIETSGEVTSSDRDCLQAEVGERVEVVAFAVGHDFHTFHLHAHTWAANRTGILTGPDDETPLIDARTLGPSESFGFQIIAGEQVGAGRWMLHCHVQAHSDAGMVTFLDVVEPGAIAPDLDAARAVHHHRHDHGA